MDKIINDQRDTRHYVANLANQLGLKQAVENERQRQQRSTGSDVDEA